MAEDDSSPNPFGAFLDTQGEAMREMWSQFVPAAAPAVLKDWSEIGAWADTARKLQAMWLEFIAAKTSANGDAAHAFDPAQFMLMSQGWQAAAQQGFAA